MKALFFLGALGALALGKVDRPVEPYRVAFDLTSRDTMDQKSVLRTVSEIIKTANPAEQVEIVMYGKGPELVVAERTGYARQVQELMASGHVTFKVCAIALRNGGIDTTQLLPGVVVVPDGIRELVLKQQEGWGYIKVGH